MTDNREDDFVGSISSTASVDYELDLPQLPSERIQKNTSSSSVSLSKLFQDASSRRPAAPPQVTSSPGRRPASQDNFPQQRPAPKPPAPKPPVTKPPVPRKLFQDGGSSVPRPAARPKVYQNSLSDEISPSQLQLSIVLEGMENESSSEDSSIAGDDSVISSLPQLRHHFTESNYTELRKSRIQEEDVYAIPVSDHVELNHEFPHQTNYTSFDNVGKPPSSNHQEKSKGPSDPPPWRLRKTLYRNHMKMVNMNALCCTGSHKRAKRFFILVAVVVTLLLLALLGIGFSIKVWRLLITEKATIEENFNDYTTSQSYCRIGRNWTSITITSNSTPFVNQTLRVPTDGALNLSLDNISMKASGLHQLLFYVVLRTDASSCTNDGSGCEEVSLALETSFINIAIWTVSNTDEDRSFRQYMSILNNSPYPQMISQSFWIPLKNTDNRLHISAELMDAAQDAQQSQVYFRAYLAGYC